MFGEGYGGYTATARHLAEVSGRLVTRQQVYMWHIRPGNGFPPRNTMVAGNGKIKSMFCLADTEIWLRKYWDLDTEKDVAHVAQV
jgi:hypothetical protein